MLIDSKDVIKIIKLYADTELLDRFRADQQSGAEALAKDLMRAIKQLEMEMPERQGDSR